MFDPSPTEDNPRLLTVSVHRRPGYRTFPVAALSVQRAPEGHGVLMIEALLYRRLEWSCLATVLVPREAARAFLRDALPEHCGQKAPDFLCPPFGNTSDRPDHQILAASGIVLRRPEANPLFFYVDCLADTALITEEHFTQNGGFWIPTGQGKQVFVRELVGTLIIQKPALVALYRDIDTATTVIPLNGAH